jgi:hypothetical protein
MPVPMPCSFHLFDLGREGGVGGKSVVEQEHHQRQMKAM